MVYIISIHTNNAINMGNTFEKCTSLIYAPTIPRNVSNIGSLTLYCSALKTITLDIIDFSVVDPGWIFNGCDVVESIYVPSQEAKESLMDKQSDILEKGLQEKSVAWNTVLPEELEEMIEKHEEREEEKEKLI